MINVIQILLGVSIGIVLWVLLRFKGNLYFSPVSDSGKRNIFILLFVVGFLCRLLFAFDVPAFQSPDEKAHLGYIQYISENKSLPIQPDVFDLDRKDYEYYQPPAYYLAMSMFYTFGNLIKFDELSNIFMIRSISVILWILTFAATWLIIKRLRLESNFSEIFLMAFVGLLPSYMFISTMINNDNLITCLAGIIFLLAIQVKDKISIKDAILMASFAAMSFLTKYTGVLLLVFLVVFIISKVEWKEIKFTGIAPIIIAAFIVVLMLAPMLIRNRELYGSFIPLSVGAHFPNWDSITYGIYRAFKNFLNTFWGVAGRTNDIKFIPAIIVGNIIALIALYGIIKGLFSKDSYAGRFCNNNISFSIASFISVMIGMMILIYYGAKYGHAQGRFIFPLIIPIGIWMAVGFKNVIGERVENTKFILNTVGLFLLSATSFTGYVLSKFIAS